MPWRTAQAPLGAAALGAYEAVAILVAPQPEGADAVIQAFGNGNVNHAPMHMCPLKPTSQAIAVLGSVLI